MKQYRIGEIFEEVGVKIVCLPAHRGGKRDKICAECAFKARPFKWCEGIACTWAEREDGTEVNFRQLDDLGENYHYSKRLDMVLGFKPRDEKPTDDVCKKCALYPFKMDDCEGALCNSMIREDRQDGYFVELGEM